MVSVPDWMKEPTGIMKLSCTGLTLLIVVIARVGFPEKSPPTGWSTDHEWLTITAACGFAIILLNWVATNLHGDGDKLPAHSEFRLMVIGAALFISSGVQSVQLHWVSETYWNNIKITINDENNFKIKTM